MRRCLGRWCVPLLLALTLLIRALPFPIAAQADFYRSVKTDTMQIAITFDDGPHPRYTPQILDILAEEEYYDETYYDDSDQSDDYDYYY